MRKDRWERGCRVALRAAALVLAISSMHGCSSITGTDRSNAEAARVTVQGTSPGPLMVITSTRFSTFLTPEGEEAVSFVLSDTVFLSLPIDRTVQFGNSDRVHISVRNPDAENAATVTVRISVDGREVYNQGAMLRDAALGFSYFLF
jgi:hypothetical protein